MTRQVLFGVAVLLLATAAPVAAADKGKKKNDDTYDTQLARYLDSVRQEAKTAAGPGSPTGWMNSLMLDTRARQVNDIVTISVVENITASGTADSSLSKKSETGISLPTFFGLEKKLPASIDPLNLVSGKHDTNFKGAGTTTRAGQLTATMTARVAEVLPNGDLLVEGVREIQINGDRQIVVLTGIARVVDIAPSNVVLSTSLGQLRIQYFGKGMMKDSLNPGFLVRLLNKIF